MYRFRLLLQFLLVPLSIGTGLTVYPTNLHAQAISGDLVGTVLDASGSGVPNAIITATNPATGAKTSGTANAAGQYRLSNLPPGNYDLSAAAQGFTTSILRGVYVQLNQTNTANLTIQIGSVATSVDVGAAAATIDTTTAQIATTYTTKEAQDLPNTTIGLGVINLSLLQSGVTSSGGVGVGSGPSVGGQRPRNNNFMVEGVDDNNKSTTGPTVNIPSESVAEFTVLQNQFQAEYGHSSGGQFNTVVKSGTNSFRAELYEYFENRNMNALDQTFANQKIYTLPRFDRNYLGANFGGPIKRDKLFFFSSFEYRPVGQASTQSAPVYAPTAAGYSTLSGVPGVSKTNLGVLQQYAVSSATTPGAPNVVIGGVTVPTGIIPIVAPNYSNAYYGIFSMDYNISDKDQLRGRFIYNQTSTINTGATLPVFFTTVPATDYLGTLAEYHIFSPSVTNEFRLGYSRYNSTSPVGSQTFPGLDAFPNLVFNNLNLQLGPNANFPQATITNLYSGVDNVTWIRGSHTIKVGTEFRKYIAPEQFTQRVRGDYEYTTVANYLLDQSPDFLAQRNLGNAVYYGDQIATYNFVQDTWRARKDLTVDLGVRYEYTTVPVGMRSEGLNAIASVPGLITFAAPKASKNGWGPRIGLAYTPGGSSNTVIRAGFGIADDVIFDNVGLNAVPPEFSTTVNTPTGGSNFLANGGITQNQGLTGTTAAAARASTSAYLPNQTLPYSINWNLGMQHVFAKDYTLEVRYLGTRGVHLLQQEQLNRQSPVTASQYIPTFFSTPSAATLAALPLNVGQLRTIGSLVPAYAAAGFTSTITSYLPTGWSFYNGLSAQLTRRFSNGLQFQGAYTWSHNIDNSTAEVASTYLTPRRAQDFTNLRVEKASSALDRRQRFTLALLYDVPFYKSSSNWAMKNLVGNWEVAPIYTYESPEYFTVQSGLDSNLNGDSAPDRTIVNPSGVAGTGSGIIGLDKNGNQVSPTASNTLTNTVVARVATNPNARYIQAGYGALANGGRNTQATRPIDNIDLSLIKRFSYKERFRFELAGHAYNVLNHPQFIPGSINNAQLVGTFTSSALSYVGAANPLFNDPTRAFSSNPRTLQITAKFFF